MDYRLQRNRPPFCPKKTTYEHIHRETLQGKRGKPEIAGQRHLEQLDILHDGHRVVPLRSGPIIPKLPQHPAQKSTQRQVQHALERMTGKKIVLETRVQPNILGGVVARVGDQVIDGSVERRLKLLQQQLLTGVSSARIDFFAEPG